MAEPAAPAVSRVAIAGATLAHALADAAAGDADGCDLALLLGRVERSARLASKREADAAAGAVGAQTVRAHIVRLAHAHERARARRSPLFYDARGRVDVRALDGWVRQAQAQARAEAARGCEDGGDAGEPSHQLLGWCVTRPYARLAPSIREAAAARSLAATGRCAIAPLLLLIGLAEPQDGSLVVSTEYSITQVDPRSGELVPTSMDVLNLGTAHGRYGGLADVAARDSAGCGADSPSLRSLAEGAESTARGIEEYYRAEASKLESVERALHESNGRLAELRMRQRAHLHGHQEQPQGRHAEQSTQEQLPRDGVDLEAGPDAGRADATPGDDRAGQMEQPAHEPAKLELQQQQQQQQQHEGDCLATHGEQERQQQQQQGPQHLQRQQEEHGRVSDAGAESGDVALWGAEGATTATFDLGPAAGEEGAHSKAVQRREDAASSPKGLDGTAQGGHESGGASSKTAAVAELARSPPTPAPEDPPQLADGVSPRAL